MSTEEAEKYKTKGNEALKNRQFEDAIKQYNKAISLDAENAIYYSNRSAVWAEMGKWENSLNDANKCIEKDSRFVKGYSRKGTALLKLCRIADARAAFQEGLVIDPQNAACKTGLATISRPRGAAGAGGSGIMGKVNQVVEQVRNVFGTNSRFQMYAMCFVGYLAFTFLTKGGGGETATPDSRNDGLRQYAFVPLPGTHIRQRISFVTKGSGPGVLLLHQPGLSYETEMLPLLELLGAEDMSVLALDLPCHGDSDCMSEHTSLDAILTEIKPAWNHPTYSVITSGASCRYIRELNADKAVFLNPELSYPPKMQTVAQIQAFLKQNDKDEEAQDVKLDMFRDATKFFVGSKYEKPPLPAGYLDQVPYPHLWLADEDVGATDQRTYMSINEGKFSMLDVETQQDILGFIRPRRVKNADGDVGHELEY